MISTRAMTSPSTPCFRSFSSISITMGRDFLLLPERELQDAVSVQPLHLSFGRTGKSCLPVVLASQRFDRYDQTILSQVRLYVLLLHARQFGHHFQVCPFVKDIGGRLLDSERFRLRGRPPPSRRGPPAYRPPAGAAG